ncbi:titin homolog [Palaemon carinicauda]|uniref:titin homolog n=1 Tax=Palaemon carinicauda TaxID=392227 RepID=UPI0035B5D351
MLEKDSTQRKTLLEKDATQRNTTMLEKDATHRHTMLEKDSTQRKTLLEKDATQRNTTMLEKDATHRHTMLEKDSTQRKTLLEKDATQRNTTMLEKDATHRHTMLEKDSTQRKTLLEKDATQRNTTMLEKDATHRHTMLEKDSTQRKTLLEKDATQRNTTMLEKDATHRHTMLEKDSTQRKTLLEKDATQRNTTMLEKDATHRHTMLEKDSTQRKTLLEKDATQRNTTMLEKDATHRHTMLEKDSTQRKTLLEKDATQRNTTMLEKDATHRHTMLEKDSTQRKTLLEKDATQRNTTMLEKEATHRHTMLEKDLTQRKTLLEKDATQRNTTLEKDSAQRNTTLEKDSAQRKTLLEKDATQRNTMLEKDATQRKTLLEKDATQRNTLLEKVTTQRNSMQRATTTLHKPLPDKLHPVLNQKLPRPESFPTSAKYPRVMKILVPALSQSKQNFSHPDLGSSILSGSSNPSRSSVSAGTLVPLGLVIPPKSSVPPIAKVEMDDGSYRTRVAKRRLSSSSTTSLESALPLASNPILAPKRMKAARHEKTKCRPVQFDHVPSPAQHSQKSGGTCGSIIGASAVLQETKLCKDRSYSGKHDDLGECSRSQLNVVGTDCDQSQPALELGSRSPCMEFGTRLNPASAAVTNRIDLEEILKEESKLSLFCNPLSFLKRKKAKRQPAQVHHVPSLAQYLEKSRINCGPIADLSAVSQETNLFKDRIYSEKPDSHSKWSHSQLTAVSSDHDRSPLVLETHSQSRSMDFGISLESASAVAAYQLEFEDIIREGGYDHRQVFSCSETGLFWKRMPFRTYIHKRAKRTLGFKEWKDRLSVVLCGNAAGHMIKPGVVYRMKNPCALKDKYKWTLPVFWQQNAKAELTASLFKQWFRGCFVPEVKLYLEKEGLPFNVLLVIGNAPSHPQDIIIENEHVRVEFLPANVSPIVLPLEQGIVKCVKASYTRQVFEMFGMAVDANPDTNLIYSWKEFTIADAIIFIRLSVDELQPETVNTCWRNLWVEVVHDFEGFPQIDEDVRKIVHLASQLGGVGMGDMSDRDILAHIEEHREELSGTELEEIMRSATEEEKDCKEYKLQNWTLERLSEVLRDFKYLKDKIKEYEPHMVRSIEVTRSLTDAMLPLQQALDEMTRRKQQQPITVFFPKQRLPITAHVMAGRPGKNRVVVHVENEKDGNGEDATTDWGYSEEVKDSRRPNT